MFRIDNATAALVAPAVPAAGAEKFFTKGDPQTAVAATVVDDWWLNMVQAELREVVTFAGLVPSKLDNTQVRQAIQQIVANSGGWPIVAKNANYQAVAGDAKKLLDFTSAATLSFVAAATLGDGWYTGVRNSSSGLLTLDPNGAELINGAATIDLKPGESCFVGCSGTAFKTLGGPIETLLIDSARTFNKPQRAAVGAIAFAASLTLDFGAYQDFVVGAANANFTVNNPSNQAAGQAGIMYFQQDGTGGRTWAFGTHFDFGVDGLPDLNTAPNGWTKVQYHVRAANTVGGITATVLV